MQSGRKKTFSEFKNIIMQKSEVILMEMSISPNKIPTAPKTQQPSFSPHGACYIKFLSDISSLIISSLSLWLSMMNIDFIFYCCSAEDVLQHQKPYSLHILVTHFAQSFEQTRLLQIYFRTLTCYVLSSFTEAAGLP